jgi:LuxR family transcriptional regulator, maltose regulon positive regulatory protein
LHLIIATREDPNLPLARLRARGQLTELRATDLRFTSTETAKFLNQVMGLDLSAEDIIALETRTEGWIAGLQMAALSMQGRADTASFIQAFTGSHHFVLDYLVEEILQRQSERIRSFLLQTSILNRLSGALCDAVCFGETAAKGNGISQKTLEYLEHANLFVIPLDDKRRWYRYHHLFADVLQTHLMEQQPNQIAALHLRASEWYQQQDLPSDAIHHAMAADDCKRAADIAELAWPAWSRSFQSIQWLGWLKELPDELVRTRPVLSLGYAWAFMNAGKLADANTRLRDVERWLEPTIDLRAQPETSVDNMVVVDKEQFQSLPLSLATARTYHSQAIGNVAGTVKYAQRVLDLIPEGDSYDRGTVTALLGLSYWTSGDLEAAHQTFSDGLENMNHLDIIVGTFVLANIKMTLGQLHEAVRLSERALRLAAENDNPIGTEDVYIGFSELHHELGDLDAAAQDLGTAKKLGEQIELPDWQHRWCIAQARLKQSLGDLDGALDLLDDAERLYVQTPLPVVRPFAALKTRVWIQQGRLDDALAWARERDMSCDDDLSYLCEFEHITLARVLVAKYRSDLLVDSTKDVLKLLERILSAAEAGGRIASVIEILILLALAHESKDDRSSALIHLEHALSLAEPEGYFQIFIDEGSPMEKLLNETAKQGMNSDYSRKLLVAFEGKDAHPNQQLIESLSERELEVLELVAQGLSNREISERLFLALDTIKGYNRKLYGKLGVKNRTQAVNKAISLKILPPQ